MNDEDRISDVIPWLVIAILLSILTAPPDLREDQMQFTRFQPELPSFTF
jgi:hypothetical protein